MSVADISSNMKEEAHKISGKTDVLQSCEHINDPNISKDLNREINKKPGGDDEQKDTQGVEQPEKDMADQILSDVKQQLPGRIDTSTVGGEVESKGVNVMSMSILSPGRPDVVLTIPFPATTSKATLFTLKEGSKYHTLFHFSVSTIVNALCYSYMVWKAGIRVCHTKKMMGTFSPRQEPYTLELEEGTTPTGFFARGPFLVRSKFVDDDGRCYLDTTYYFDIRKDWGGRDKC